MRKQVIQNAAYEVATQVRAVEDSIDGALNEIAELQSRIMHMNSLAGVGYGVVHPTLQKLAEAVTGLVGTRGAIVACHAELADAKQKVPGLREVSWGDGEDCPDNTAKVDLRVVA
jgi:hypothetical protein